MLKGISGATLGVSSGVLKGISGATLGVSSGVLKGISGATLGVSSVFASNNSGFVSSGANVSDVFLLGGSDAVSTERSFSFG